MQPVSSHCGQRARGMARPSGTLVDPGIGRWVARPIWPPSPPSPRHLGSVHQLAHDPPSGSPTLDCSRPTRREGVVFAPVIQLRVPVAAIQDNCCSRATRRRLFRTSRCRHQFDRGHRQLTLIAYHPANAPAGLRTSWMATSLRAVNRLTCSDMSDLPFLFLSPLQCSCIPASGRPMLSRARRRGWNGLDPAS